MVIILSMSRFLSVLSSLQVRCLSIAETLVSIARISVRSSLFDGLTDLNAIDRGVGSVCSGVDRLEPAVYAVQAWEHESLGGARSSFQFRGLVIGWGANKTWICAWFKACTLPEEPSN
jgi:hypothetical protein